MTHMRVTPAVGSPTTTFAVHLRFDGGEGDEAESVEIIGPAGTACAGPIATISPGGDYGAGPLTLLVGPRAVMDEKTIPFLVAIKRWCPGRYVGRLTPFYAPSYVLARFSFIVRLPNQGGPA